MGVTFFIHGGTGSDANDGSFGSPFLSIERAYAAAYLAGGGAIIQELSLSSYLPDVSSPYLVMPAAASVITGTGAFGFGSDPNGDTGKTAPTAATATTNYTTVLNTAKADIKSIASGGAATYNGVANPGTLTVTTSAPAERNRPH
jgi:hypothetical protein